MRCSYTHRKAVVWLCIAAAVLLGIGAQLHGLSHALQAVQAAAHNNDPLAAHTQACDQCLQFAALDGAATSDAAATVAAAAVLEQSATQAPGRHVARFSAYLSRAPPPLG